MKIFLAGIMQGSHREPVLHEQGYRTRIKDLLVEHIPGVEVDDPLADHGDSIAYDDETGSEVFFGHNRMCRTVDAVLAFVPEASMGMAIEIRYKKTPDPFSSARNGVRSAGDRGRELEVATLASRITHTKQSIWPSLLPARCPGEVRLTGVPLGWDPSLDRFRRWFSSTIVRRIRRYYAPI
jgi:hypothetical protein